MCQMASGLTAPPFARDLDIMNSFVSPSLGLLKGNDFTYSMGGILNQPFSKSSNTLSPKREGNFRDLVS